MIARYKYEKWECQIHGVAGRDMAGASEHYDHPAGWKDGGNTHPEIDKWAEDHPDRIRGFFWGVTVADLPGSRDDGKVVHEKVSEAVAAQGVAKAQNAPLASSTKSVISCTKLAPTAPTEHRGRRKANGDPCGRGHAASLRRQGPSQSYCLACREDGKKAKLARLSLDDWYALGNTGWRRAG